MRAAIVGALVGSVATGAALAKQEPLKPERPTIETQHDESAPRCRSFRLEWWVKTAEGELKLAGSQIVTRCE